MAKTRIRYSAETKVKIAQAVAQARKTGTWKDAHAAAQKLGYKGSQDGLVKLLTENKAKKVAAKKALQPAKVKAPATQTSLALDPVAAQYLCSSIDKAIAELQKLRKLYAR